MRLKGLAIGMIVFLLTGLCCQLWPADAATVEVKKPEIQETDYLWNILSRNVGMKLTLKLRGGAELTGKVTSVHQNVVVLSELSGKEFFDAAIRADEISAIIYRTKSQ